MTEAVDDVGLKILTCLMALAAALWSSAVATAFNVKQSVPAGVCPKL